MSTVRVRPFFSSALLHRFIHDQRGVFAVIFGVMAVVLVATAGAVVDFITVDQLRNRSQIALDAAALALQPEIYSKTSSQIKTSAQKLLTERVNDAAVNATVTSAELDKSNGRLTIKARLTVPLSFVALIGINQMTTEVVSQVTRKKLYIEVAMVLDNSGSMSAESRIANLRTAATCATKILFYGSCNPASSATKDPHTKVAVVPFTFFVRPVSGYSTSIASWVDKAGVSDIAKRNLDAANDGSAVYSAVDRIALMSSMGQTWKGCFETRKYPYSVDDTTPTAADPNTLFVPEFAPDEPGNAGYPTAGSSGVSGFNNSYVNDYPTTSQCDVTLGTCTCSSSTYTYSCGTRWSPRTCTGTTTTCSYVASNGSTNSCSCSSGLSSCPVSYTPSGLSDRKEQERICKYAGATVHTAYDTARHEPYTQGPNAGCPDAAIQPLSDNVSSITSQIAAMDADGGTNIEEGVAWGFRVLSPTAPFTEGRPYGTATSKVIIMMTDGENTYWHVDRRNEPSVKPNMNGTFYYMPYGYQYNQQLTINGTGPYQNSDGDKLQLKMNTLTLEACTNAKNAGITIYTIGLKAPNQTTIDMLKSCASATSMAYFPTDSSQLNTVFSSIAEQLSQLRIEK